MCVICPRACGAERNVIVGYCGCTNDCRVARIGLHHFEEPCISGTCGSGTIFFSGCNLRCVYCQNMPLQSGRVGQILSARELCDTMLRLQDIGAHNINLVTPTPHLLTVCEAIARAKAQGLTIPILYNTSAYETTAAIEQLCGLVDIYLPDLKYKSTELSARFSACMDYFEKAWAAILAMFAQVGHLQLDEDGIATRGVLIRHLVLPGCAFDTRDVLSEIAATFSPDCHLSLMRQYTPLPDIQPPLNRSITDREYESCVDHCLSLGFSHVYVQDKKSASFAYTPEFYDKLPDDYDKLHDFTLA